MGLKSRQINRTACSTPSQCTHNFFPKKYHSGIIGSLQHLGSKTAKLNWISCISSLIFLSLLHIFILSNDLIWSHFFAQSLQFPGMITSWAHDTLCGAEAEYTKFPSNQMSHRQKSQIKTEWPRARPQSDAEVFRDAIREKPFVKADYIYLYIWIVCNLDSIL